MGFCHSPLPFSGYLALKSLGLPMAVPPSSSQGSLRYYFPSFCSLCPAQRAPVQQRHEPLALCQQCPVAKGREQTAGRMWLCPQVRLKNIFSKAKQTCREKVDELFFLQDDVWYLIRP